MRTLVCLLITALLLSGCGGTATTATRPNTTKQQSDKDHYDCYQDSMRKESAGAGIYGGSASYAHPNLELYTYCMQARGYTVKSEWHLLKPD